MRVTTAPTMSVEISAGTPFGAIWAHICPSLCWRNVFISKSHPPKPWGFGGGWFFFGLKCRKFDSGTQVFCWTFFRHKHTYSNTPHPKKSICTHHRHKNRFHFFQKIAVLAKSSEKILLQKLGHLGRFFKRKMFFLKTYSKCPNQVLRMFWG